ncbi:MAG: DUF3180 domain-containing protein [Terracoccus sp.]
MNPHAGVRITTLVLAGVATTVVAWLGLRWLAGSSTIEPGWVGLAAMLFLSGGLLAAGWQVRQVRDGRSLSHVTALRAARTLVLGQAGALTGAVLVGWYFANVLVLLPDSDIESQRSRLWLFAAHVAVALLLAVSGMFVQRWCRLRRRDDDDDDLA